jgi:hypothetical protein
MRTRLQRWALLATLFCLPAWLGLGQADSVDVYQLTAAFVFKFAQFTTWTAQQSEPGFTICLWGGDSFGDAFGMVEGKTLNDKPVGVKYLSSTQPLAHCQVAYLHPASRKELVDWMQKVDSLPILTVSDFPDASKENVMIEFTSEPNRVTFKVNLSAARRSGLEFSAKVLQLAQEIR